MNRYFIWLSFDGTAYHGWQIQPSAVSVQQCLQESLSTILRSVISVVGAGRTDAGVHARNMAAHFDTTAIIDCAQLKYKLNKLLPKDISVNKIQPTDIEKHARFSAISRTYHYYIHTHKSPFLRHYSFEAYYKLDFDLMNEAALLLLQHDDFKAFCKSHTDVKTTLCTITEARWIKLSDHEWYFRISANRFLRNMVRAIVGTLIEVGRGRMTIGDFENVIAGKNRTMAGDSMPGRALFLEDVKY